MKKWYSFLILALISINVMAQTGNTAKQDVIQKLNGEEMKGKVIEITDTDVTFVYAGETAEYVIKKSEIGSIVHSSGRVERINQQNSPAETRQKDPVNMSASPADHHNNQTHKAFFSNTDGSYGSPLEYLLKRSPLYRK